MAGTSTLFSRIQAADRYGTAALRAVVIGLAGLSGAAVLAMMAITCTDVLFRACGHTLTGAYDLVCMAGVTAIACALPYTTAVKGHVAIEYFFQKLRRRGRIVVDVFCRLLAAALFSMFTWQCIAYGNSLRRTGEVSLTLEIPVYWLAHLIGVCCGVSVLVIVYNMLHPGRGMLKP